MTFTKLPPDVRWQDLKDSLRHDRNIRARPGWTDVVIQMSSGKAVRQGVFKIKDVEEANRVYCWSPEKNKANRLTISGLLI